MFKLQTPVPKLSIHQILYQFVLISKIFVLNAHIMNENALIHS
ncbi:unnamed protein product [Meloidogyne enterolobii]|uniref:Uncharacterized protein n=1 Tax=Meloidogyne enterolobii TaxID=390850 RepID=A0ACB0YBV5_MELEN